MPRPETIALEVCVDTPEGIVACQGLADRIELCAGLAIGGLTPGEGLIAAARDSAVPVHAMIRPVPGGFDYDNATCEACVAEVAHMRAAGLAGVVVGVTRQGALHREALARLVAAAGPLEVTLHRAVDLLDDAGTAVDLCADLGIARILTSGGTARAEEGLARIAAMVARSRGRVQIMAGGGVTAENAARILAATGVQALHGSCAAPVPGSARAAALGFEGAGLRRTDRDRIAALRRAIDGAAA